MATHNASFKAEQARLVQLLNTEPARAVDEARRLPADADNWLMLRACMLTDGGAAAQDAAAVEEGIRLFRELVAKHPMHAELKYNLANGLDALATLELKVTPVPDWYLRTVALRHESRALLGQAAKELKETRQQVATQCLTNLANGLDRSFRWIEAYEANQAALAVFAKNGVASGVAARILFRVAEEGVIGNPAHLRSVARRLARHAQRNHEVVAEFAGPSAVESFAQLPSDEKESTPSNHGLSSYEQFVAHHRLALSPVVEGLGQDVVRWDDAQIAGVTEDLGTGSTVPAIFAMFNVLKADFLLARQLLYDGLDAQTRDTGFYADTLDYALYGRKSALLTLAQRSAVDLLDRIAVALNDYFKVGLQPWKVHFVGFWQERGANPKWRKPLADEIEAGNPALVALSEIAADLSNSLAGSAGEGLLYKHRELRNAGTHRFTVLHDIGPVGYRESECVEHRSLTDFERTAIETMKLARAALLHFVEAIAYREQRLKRGRGKVGVLDVLPHHYIRGEE